MNPEIIPFPQSCNGCPNPEKCHECASYFAFTQQNVNLVKAALDMQSAIICSLAFESKPDHFPDGFAILKEHGWNPDNENANTFIRRKNKNALNKSRGVKA